MGCSAGRLAALTPHAMSHDSHSLALSIIVPVYRSEDCLEALAAAVAQALDGEDLTYELILVDDGSPDGSWGVIESLCRRDAHVVGVGLRRNFGQDNAILAGLRLARGAAVAVMDDDLQHDPADLPALVAKLDEGADVVYADFRIKQQRLWKNLGSWFNGKVAEWVLDKPKGLYLSPYKVMRREVAELAAQYEGPDPYLDALLLQVTSRFAVVTVEHHPRYAGAGNYTLRKSIQVWARMATSFSVRPLRLVTWCGLAMGALGGLLAVLVVIDRLVNPERFALALAGWASLMVALLVIGGIQMVFLGILGEYAGRTHTRVVGKPQSTIRAVVGGLPQTGHATRVPDDTPLGGII